MPLSPWVLSERRAKLSIGTLAAQLDADQPRRGLSHIAFSGGPIANAALFQIGIEQRAENLSASSGDVYVRGDDLIATYEKTDQRPLRVQLLWRALSAAKPAQAFGVELVVSVQTDLLDSDPELTITSSLPATDVRRLLAADGSQFATVAADARPGARDFTSPPGCFLFRISPQTSYLEMVHPSDFRQMAITSPTGTAEKLFGVQTRLFAERLEKGVILRSRLRGWFLAREADETAAVQLYREFCATEPPLTA